jgi:hypothetical protein
MRLSKARMPLILRGVILFLLIGLMACAGVRNTSQSFINETTMNDSTFQATASADWKAAQHAVATQPINLAAGSFGVHDVPPDPRALTIQPHAIVVRSIPDAPGRPGIIPCHSVTGFCYAYLDNEHTIIVPQSKPQNMGPYEMETVILWELGYDVRGR